MTKMYQDTFPVERKLQHLQFDWRGRSVFEIGCNIGQMGNYVLSQGASSYKGVDVNAEYVAEGKLRYPHLDLSVMNARALGGVDADVFVALGVFHHMEKSDVRDLISRCQSQVILMEQPVSCQPFQNYKMRCKKWYLRICRDAGFSKISEFKYGFTYPIERVILLAERTQ